MLAARVGQRGALHFINMGLVHDLLEINEAGVEFVGVGDVILLLLPVRLVAGVVAVLLVVVLGLLHALDARKLLQGNLHLVFVLVYDALQVDSILLAHVVSERGR